MLKTGKEYVDGLRNGRVVYIGNERVNDVTTHPAFRNASSNLRGILRFQSRPNTPEADGLRGRWPDLQHLLPSKPATRTNVARRKGRPSHSCRNELWHARPIAGLHRELHHRHEPEAGKSSGNSPTTFAPITSTCVIATSMPRTRSYRRKPPAIPHSTSVKICPIRSAGSFARRSTASLSPE